MCGDSTNGLDLEALIRRFVIGELPASTEERVELEEQSASNLLIIYFNWVNRLIPARPRRVHISNELRRTAPSRPDLIRAALRRVIQDVESGNDLTRYLSKGINTAYVSKNERSLKPQRRYDLDLLLNAWGVHHLHLSMTTDENDFVSRSDSLLFATFTPTDAHFIEIMTHRDFHRLHILEVMHRNWPDQGLVLQSISGVRLNQRYSEEEAKELRQAGVTVVHEIDGRVVMPRDMVTTAGTSMQATRRAIRIMHTVLHLQQELATDPSYLKRQFDTTVFPEPPRWQFVLTEQGYGIQEEQTKATVLLD